MIIIFCLGTLMFPMAGCSPVATVKKTAKKLSRSVKSSKGDLKKRLGMAPFFNWSSFQDENLEGILLNNIEKSLNAACGDLVVLTPENQEYPLILNHLPRLTTGGIDNLALAKMGRKYGLNGILTGGFVDIAEKQEERGFSWFRGTHYFVQLSINFEVYDTETGAKFFDESLVQEVEIEEIDFESIRSKNESIVSSIQDAILDLADEMGERICEAVSSKPWIGYVASVVKEKIIISSGSNAGIIPDQLFEVYDSGTVVQGAEGQRFFVPGKKIGEIRINIVLPDKAIAVPVSGEGIKKGDSVRLK